MVEAIELHIRGMKEEKLPIPQGTASAEILAIPA
jgi:predicted RNase H-like HicB family nuclease